MFNLDPPAGFRGLDPDLPIQHYVRRLPHWRQDGATYFVTFRTADSLPQSKLRELESVRQDFYRQYGPHPDRETLDILTKQIITLIEKWLDQGMGKCRLRDREYAEIVASSFRHFDNGRYQLGCFIVMPNHAHVVARPLAPQATPLEKILQSWKRHSANEINRLLGEVGTFWQPESYDRIIRDEEHLYRVIQYIGRNPKLANLAPSEYQFWIRPEWQTQGWGLREE